MSHNGGCSLSETENKTTTKSWILNLETVVFVLPSFPRFVQDDKQFREDW